MGHDLRDGERRLTLRACAKINLALDLLGPRPDGYTEIATVFQSVDLADTVDLVLEAAGAGILLEVVGEAPCSAEQNLAVRAAQSFAAWRGLSGRLSIRLAKRIPVGAGLGGGSADAAAVLRGLDQLTGGKVGAAELARLAATLGADAPFFLTGGAALGRGRGDSIEAWQDLPSWSVVLTQVGAPLSTAEVYRRARRGLTTRQDAPNIQRFVQRLRERPDGLPSLGNALLPAAATLEPRIPRVIERLERLGGCAGMTGSGAAVFGLFEGVDAACEAAGWLAREEQPRFLCVTRTLPRADANPPTAPAN